MESKPSIIWTKAFWRSLAERVGASVLGVFVSFGAFDVAGVLDVRQWKNIAIAAIGAGVFSLLKGLLAGLSGGGPSLGGGEVIESVAIPADEVLSKDDPGSPSGESAGPGSDLPNDTPTITEPLEQKPPYRPGGYTGL